MACCVQESARGTATSAVRAWGQETHAVESVTIPATPVPCVAKSRPMVGPARCAGCSPRRTGSDPAPAAPREAAQRMRVVYRRDDAVAMRRTCAACRSGPATRARRAKSPAQVRGLARRRPHVRHVAAPSRRAAVSGRRRTCAVWKRPQRPARSQQPPLTGKPQRVRKRRRCQILQPWASKKGWVTAKTCASSIRMTG